MARFRKLYHQIWSDPDFQEYSPEQKLIFIYLLSNSKTTESGIYNITPKTVADETNIPLTTVKELLNNGFKNIVYDITNYCVYVRKFRVYNPGGSPELITKSVIADYRSTQKTKLWSLFTTDYPKYKDNLINDGLKIDEEYLNGIGIGICSGSGSGSGIERLENRSETVQPPLNNKVKELVSIYESNIGIATPMVLDEIIFIADTYPDGWFGEAVKESVNYNKRNIAYIKKILSTWESDGKNNGRKKRVSDGWD